MNTRTNWTGRAVLAAPVLLVNAVAVAGQYAWADANLPHWDILGVNVTAVAFALALESIAIYLAYEAHAAQMAGDSSLKLRLGSYGMGVLVGALNYWHWAAVGTHAATPAAVAFGGLSAVSPWLWAIRSRSQHREQLRGLGLVEPRAVKFASARWLLYPKATYGAFRAAVWAGETDPMVAVALVQPVTEPGSGAATPSEPKPNVAVREQPPAAPSTSTPRREPARKPTPRPTLTQEQGRAILLDLPDFEKVTDAWLSRKHGMSDRWWAGVRKKLRGELAAMTQEAQELRASDPN